MIICVKTPGALMVNAFMGFSQYKALVITCSVILLHIIYSFIRRRKKRKEKERERIVRPVTDVIGTNQHLAEINEILSLWFAYVEEDIFYSIMDAGKKIRLLPLI